MVLTENKVDIVLVLYKQSVKQIPSYAYLTNAVAKGQLRLLVYDNSPKKQEDVLFSMDHTYYFHNGNNPGISEAYNWALGHTQGDLLLALDQDTQVDGSYLHLLEQVRIDRQTSAVVPKIISGDRQISPLDATRYIDHRAEPITQVGNNTNHIMAINSGTAFNVSYLKQIGGFSTAFPLDFLDHWFFWKSYDDQMKVKIVDYTLAHDLSVLNYENVSLTRYRSILAAETLFYQTFDRSLLKRHHRQLLLRTIKQFLTVKNRKIWHQTFEAWVNSTRG